MIDYQLIIKKGAKLESFAPFSFEEGCAYIYTCFFI
jgi:hypothetical protein